MVDLWLYNKAWLTYGWATMHGWPMAVQQCMVDLWLCNNAWLSHGCATMHGWPMAVQQYMVDLWLCNNTWLTYGCATRHGWPMAVQQCMVDLWLCNTAWLTYGCQMAVSKQFCVCAQSTITVISGWARWQEVSIWSFTPSQPLQLYQGEPDGRVVTDTGEVAVCRRYGWQKGGLYKPMMVMAPLAVAATTASITLFVPLAKFSNSNTPGGLHTQKYRHMKSERYCTSLHRLKQYTHTHTDTHKVYL